VVRFDPPDKVGGVCDVGVVKCMNAGLVNCELGGLFAMQSGTGALPLNSKKNYLEIFFYKFTQQYSDIGKWVELVGKWTRRRHGTNRHRYPSTQTRRRRRRKPAATWESVARPRSPRPPTPGPPVPLSAGAPRRPAPTSRPLCTLGPAPAVPRRHSAARPAARRAPPLRSTSSQVATTNGKHSDTPPFPSAAEPDREFLRPETISSARRHPVAVHALAVTGMLPEIHSGARYPMVPRTVVRTRLNSLPTSFAMPKSATLGTLGPRRAGCSPG
jgi:hypothetical protein